MSKPIHPATVHFPIAFLFLGFGMDFIHALGDKVPAAASAYLPSPSDLTRASYYLILLGLISAVPAIITGVQQNILMIAKQGMYEPDGKTVKTKVKAAIAHAVTIDIALAITGYAWYARRQQVLGSLAGKAGLEAVVPNAYAPEMWVVAAEAVAFGILGFGANIGGALVYNYGVGFSAAGAGMGKKKQ